MPPKDTHAILAQIRALMSNVEFTDHPLDAFIVPSYDSHYSEYTADCDQRRAYITGFTGSAGTAVITRDKALLWTDGRYYTQATEEIDQNWQLMKQGLPNTPTQSAWLKQNLKAGAYIGIDPMLYTEEDWEQMTKELTGRHLTPIKKNLVDAVWQNRPARPSGPVKELPLEFAGKSTSEKLRDLRESMVVSGSDVLVVSELDEIAWLLNLRGVDIEYNPVFFAWVLVTLDGFELFINPSKLNDTIRANLQKEGGNVSFHPYENIVDRLSYHVKTDAGNIHCSKRCAHALVELVPHERRVIKLTPISLMKCKKNPVEVQGIINAHIRDAVALCDFFAWLETEMSLGNKVTEVSAAEKLLSFRAQQTHFVGMSFPSISSSGPNAAIIHYQPSTQSDRQLSLEEPYLIDSGGQYLDGTTDVTRTLHFGTPTDYQKDCFTRVLKGVIALVSTSFPTKVVGNTLDTLARKALWDVGLDYNHGTGHGIGAYLNVHEGPVGISYRHIPDDPGLDVNMFVSNEPGYYEEGNFGIRIENIIRIVKATLPNNFGGRGFLKFEDVTFVPIQQKMIKPELLTQAEIDYINEYHSECRRIVGGYIDANNLSEPAFQWLLKETEPLRFPPTRQRSTSCTKPIVH